MKIIGFDDLYYSEFVIGDFISKPQYWHARGSVYDSLDKPKMSHTFLWFKNCSGTVVSPDGRTLEVQKNQLLYTAKESKYIIYFHDTAPERPDTVVIHFQMTDKDGEDIAPSLSPMICIKNVDTALGIDIDMLADEFRNNLVCIPEVKSVIYKIFSVICRKSRRALTKHNKFDCIKDGIELLEKDSDLGIMEIARSCGVSECYFRRLFREYSGHTPMEYRQLHRIEKAKQLLLSDDMLTVGEIARELHFNDIYHFSKTFKNITGQSPSAFIKSAEQR